MLQDALTIILPDMYMYWGTFGEFNVPLFTPVASLLRLARWRAIGSVMMLCLLHIGSLLPIEPMLSLLLIAGPKGLSPPAHIVQALDPHLAHDKLHLWLNLRPDDVPSKDLLDPLQQWLINEMDEVVIQVRDSPLHWYST